MVYFFTTLNVKDKICWLCTYLHQVLFPVQLQLKVDQSKLSVKTQPEVIKWHMSMCVFICIYSPIMPMNSWFLFLKPLVVFQHNPEPYCSFKPHTQMLNVNEALKQTKNQKQKSNFTSFWIKRTVNWWGESHRNFWRSSTLIRVTVIWHHEKKRWKPQAQFSYFYSAWTYYKCLAGLKKNTINGLCRKRQQHSCTKDAPNSTGCTSSLLL